VPGADEPSSNLERAKAIIASGAYDQAEQLLTEIIRTSPALTEAFLLRGQAREQQADDDGAIDDYSEAVQRDLNELLSFAQRLISFTSRGDFAAAVADADLSMRINQRLCRSCFLRGGIYSRRNDWSRAIADYNQILQLDPTNSVAYLRRGHASARLGEWSKAVADYTESLRLDPQGSEAFNSRGEALLRQGQTEQAISDFTSALRLDPHFADARINRADAHLRRGEYDQAITDFNQAIHLQPTSARAHAGRAVARLEKGEWDRALSDISKSLSLDPASANSPETPRINERLRAVHEQMVTSCQQFRRLLRQTAEGIGHSPPSLTESPPPAAPASTPELELPPTRPSIAAAIVAAPPQPALAPPSPVEPPSSRETVLPEDESVRQRRLAARQCHRGQVFQKEGDHDRAIAAYTAALAADPNCVEAYRERGQLLRLVRRLDEALEDFHTAIALEPDADLYFRRGVVHAEQRDFNSAFADFDEAIERDPQLALAYLNRGLVSVIVGKFEDAARDADLALEIDPSLTRARFLRGVAHGKLGRHDLAVGDFDVVLEEDPENARAHNHRGLAFAAEGKFDEAIAAYDEAIRLCPDLWAAYFNRGIAHHLEGDHDGAIAAFTDFVENRPQYAPAYHQRGLAYLAKKEFDAAIADFTSAFQLDPNLTEAYTSCMEATRLRYEVGTARTPGRSGVTARPAPRDLLEPGNATSRLAELSGRDRPTPLPLPPEPDHSAAHETREEARDSTAAVAAAATVPEGPRLPEPPSGKLQLECPECGTPGLLDMRHLGKKFRCPGCHLWWRTGIGGDLEETTAPDDVVRASPEEGPKSGIWKPLATPAKPEKPGGAVATSAAPAATLTEPALPSTKKDPEPESPAAKPGKSGTAQERTSAKPTRRRKESSLRYASQWVGAAVRTWTARGVALCCLLISLLFIPYLFPSLFPSELRARGQEVAKAWLAKDSEKLKSFADPTLVENVPRWLEVAPPPDLNEGRGGANVTVTVDRKADDKAEVLIQIKSAKPDGTPAFYVFRHRWAQRKGTWYLQPEIPPTSTAPAPPKAAAKKR
jgi:tetratricopeptide (TPR) repeat protein